MGWTWASREQQQTARVSLSPLFRIPHNHIDITFHKHKPAYSETPPEWIHSVDPRFDLKREVVLEAVVRSRERVRQGHVSERVSE